MIRKDLAQSIIDDILNGVAEFERIAPKLRNIEDEELKQSLMNQLAELLGRDVDSFMGRILYHHPELDPLNKKG